MATAHIKVDIPFEEFVRLACWDKRCDYNLKYVGSLCNLKQVEIGEDGKCKSKITSERGDSQDA